MPQGVLNYYELKMLYQSTYLSVKYISTEMASEDLILCSYAYLI